MAARKKKSQAPDGFPEKWYKKLPSTWLDGGADSKKSEDLKAGVLKSETVISDTEKDMDNDNKLTNLKEEVKDLSAAYKDTIDAERAKIRYSMYLLRMRGEQ
jgi:hypothetical protein